MSNHEKKVHDPARVKDKECPLCPDKFFDNNSLTTHIKAHLDEKPYACSYPDCNVRRVHKSAIKAHEITHRTEKKIQCDHPGCSYKTKLTALLRKHKDIHDPHRSKQFQCTLCPKTFFNEFSMRTHMQSHTQEKPYKCPNCDFSAPTPSRLKSHRCSRKNPLHCLNIRLRQNSSNPDQDFQMKYECELCDYSTKHSGKVKGHIMTVHIELLDDVEGGAKQYKCRECEIICGCFSTAKTHWQLHSQAKPFRCTFEEGCDFQARLIRQLQKHMKEAHKADRVLPTTYCEECKRSVSSRHWNLHLKLHVGPFDCMACGYSTRLHSRYFRHIEGKQHQKNVLSLQ